MKINITGGIGFDFTGESLREKTNGYDGDLDLHINSPGGDIYDGIEIFNEIKNYERTTGAKVTAHLMGFVGSAASYLSMAASTRIAYDNSVFMIHNASMVMMGDSAVFKFWANDLAKTDALISRAYESVTGKSSEEIMALMSAGKDNNGTYFYGKEIQKAGFADLMANDGETGDKGNRTNECKMMYANFKRNTKPKEYDHERIVALVGEHKSNIKDKDIGEETVKKDEILTGLTNLKENQEITLPEIAKHLNLSGLVKSDEEKANIAAYGEVKALCGEAEPKEFIESLISDKKANAEEVRKAKFNEAFGSVENEKTGKMNHARAFAETLVGSSELSGEKINEVKGNETFKKLLADQADHRSKFNVVDKPEPVSNDGVIDL